ncbi:MAG: N-6 DNA methylase [Saprospiraceae bacterium]|nr:N-6 DNA methylase [Saprospiraceae bacterium]
MLDTQTKKRIDDCRDILVGKLPDPKAQIEQITIGLIYKFMDDMDKEAIELGGAPKFFSGDYEKYAWDKLFDTRVTASEMLNLYSEAIVSMDKNPNIPGLFRDIFKNAFLPYRDPETLKMFLKTIGEFEYTHSEKLGDAFEYLLSVMGSQGDAGQFRTPRHIIDFLVAIIDPDKGDSILDPACGTAGFLISAYKHILLKYSTAAMHCASTNIFQYNQLPDSEKFSLKGDQLTPDDRKKLIRNFAGYDISPDMVRLSLVNLYLHGFPDPHINEYDTLSSEDRWNENFDVVLANPPFMSPKGGIRPHKKFTISSNRSEVLFVDYIAEHLNPKGKAGIIVPEGVIFQSGTAYKDLRKMLVENYLYAVVSLPAGVFNPYSGVKTSILLMDKDIARQRNEILFVKIDNDGYNLGAQRAAVKGSQLEEAIALTHEFATSGEIPDSLIAHAVLRTEIAANGDYNLSGERYRLTEARKSDFPIVSLGDLIKVDNGRVLTEFQENGEIPCIKVSDMNLPENSSEIVTTSHWVKETSYPLLPINSIVFPKRGAAIATNKKRFTKIPCLIDNNCMGISVIDEEKLNPKYLFAFMNQFDLSSISNSAGIALINNPDIKGVKIPLPPLSIQEEIVAEIEGYQKIIDGAKAVVANYKPKIDIDPDWEMVELGEHCKIKGGNAFKSTDYVDEGVLLIRMGNVKQMFFDWENSPSYLPFNYLDDYPNYVLEKGDLLISMTGTVGKVDYGNVCQIDLNERFLLNQRVGKFEIQSNQLDREYLYFVAQTDHFRKQLFANASGGVRQANISNKGIESISIPFPSIEIQRQIVAQIEKEQTLVNANKQLIEIFEQKIKDKIAKVWGVEKTVEETLIIAAELEVIDNV